jgi:hypothetical protein
VNYHIFAQAIEQPDGRRVIRITFANGAVHEFPAPRQDVAPNRVTAEHYLGGGGVDVTAVYPGANAIIRHFSLEELPPHEHP